MLTVTERVRLREDVEQYIERNHHVEPATVEVVSDVVLNNWFAELDAGGSHLTADLIAADIVDIANKYCS
ncbi:hypothetical protein GGG87_06820 [Streptococcus sp. zg-86]|uniref:Uncharacterized protein n=1 Tax=Streptococcus zhangguiae TaxID=2664091 RepID=A0A6I4RGP5_9STRE|nr:MULTISPECIES: hypothetical protein [unclassified Streptococcus]MTB64703.1 hypothetical protein [Streptococcus sp. zg-86]MTB91013.1 hypothetical protein [Streptococcus sp. zg-36]MWV56564.1 hypothetical protein [Streptococcus sp. zg-70]QTH48528.1 hypothetical protein J5M87_04175 [Streptococcus sp. zg-86]